MSEPRPADWIDTLLSDAARHAQWPATPDLRPGVAHRMDRPAAPGRRLPSRRVLGTAVAALVLLVVTVLVNPTTRSAIAEFFGLVEGYRIEVLPTSTPVEPSSGTPAAAPTATPLEGVATRSTIEVASAAAGLTPTQLAAAGEPEIYLARAGRTFVILRYPRVDLWQSREGVPGMIVKTLPEGTVVETPLVRGRAAYWVSGVERTLRFLDGEGREIPGSARTVGRNALIWSGVDRLYRLETDLPLSEALRLADSLP
jgi:hypothetical protein